MKVHSGLSRTWLAIATALCLAAGAAEAVRADGGGSMGAVYTLSNDAAGNQLIVFQRDRAGGLSLAGTVATGGMGLGQGLGSQGALNFGACQQALYAVNAGSNDVTVLTLGQQGPRAVQIVDSGGLQPIGLTARNDVLYVLNHGSAAGDVDQITGFQIDQQSQRLTLLPNSTQDMSAANVNPAQVGFDPSGRVLVVTEKATNSIDTFRVNRQGYAREIQVQPSSGIEPFGFAFNNKGHLIDTEAFGGAAGASAVSSYSVDSGTGLLRVVSASVPTMQTAACWLSVTRGGRYAYSSNTGSGTVTGFRVDNAGTLTPRTDNGITGVTGGEALDSAIVDDKFLYVLSVGAGGSTITGFAIAHDGSLTLIGSVGGLPVSTVGLAAR